jgi:hypothetical protein
MPATRSITPAQSRRVGYKVLYSVCEDPADVAARIDGVAVSPDVAECEDAAALARWDRTESCHPIIEAAAAWMAEVVADDVTTSDDTPEVKEGVKDEFASDFAAFGVALLGVLLEEGYIILTHE